jgi:hypothetical protein
MRNRLLIFSLILSVSGFSQQKNKVIPVDKSILRLTEDTVDRPELLVKKSQDFDYTIVINKMTNKKDTVMVDRSLFVDKKRKPKN